MKRSVSPLLPLSLFVIFVLLACSVGCQSSQCYQFEGIQHATTNAIATGQTFTRSGEKLSLKHNAPYLRSARYRQYRLGKDADQNRRSPNTPHVAR